MELNNDDLSSVTGGDDIGNAIYNEIHNDHAQKHGGIAQMGKLSLKGERYGFLWRKKADVLSQKVTYNDGTSKTMVIRNKLQ